jgi:tyrosine-protein kinase Etk/Wzc
MYKTSPFKVDYTVKNPAFYDIPVHVTFLDEKRFQLRYRIGAAEYMRDFEFNKYYENADIKFRLYKTDSYTSDVINFEYFFTINSRGSLLSYMASNTTAQVLNASANTIRIFFSDYHPVKARDVVSMLDSVYLEQTLEKKNRVNQQTLDFLDEQLDSTAIKLAMSEQEVENFIQRNRVLDIRDQVANMVVHVEDLTKQKLQLEMQLALLKDLRNTVLQNRDLRKIIPSLKYIDDDEILNLTKTLSELQNEKEMMSYTAREGTLAAKLRENKIENLRGDLIKVIDETYRFVNKNILLLKKEIIQYETRFLSIPTQDKELTRIRRFYELNEKFYLMLVEKKAEFSIAKAGTVPEFQILTTAVLPVIPILPQKGNVYLAWIAVALFAGISLVTIRYFLQDSIVTQKELEKSTVAAVLGVIPVYIKEHLKVATLVVDKNPKSGISEALRSIRTNIEFILPQNDNKRIISVTSTIAGEGKTFIAINLSGILALSNQKVIMLDMDMRKPKLHLAFDLNNEKGMSTVLSERHKASDCICKTHLDNIDVIPAGPVPPNPSELIMRPFFKELLKELHQTYDTIIIDCPPVGLVTDGILVMQHVDLPIYVVRSEYSKKIYVRNINKLVRINGFKNLSVVLNGLDNFKTYGYGYGYGYEYYSEDKSDKKGFDTAWVRSLFGKG